MAINYGKGKNDSDYDLGSPPRGRYAVSSVSNVWQGLDSSQRASVWSDRKLKIMSERLREFKKIITYEIIKISTIYLKI